MIQVSKENIESNSVEVVNIREDRKLRQRPFLIPIREAVVCVFDFLVESLQNANHPKLTDLSGSDVNRLICFLNLPDNEHTIGDTLDELYEVLWLHKATAAKCKKTSRAIGLYLSSKYPGEYVNRVLASKTHEGLDFFDYHEIAVVEHCKSRNFVGLSVSNIFNHSFFERRGYNFTVPEYRGRMFSRDTDFLVSPRRELIHEVIKEIEGEESRWEDVTDFIHTEPSFGRDAPDGTRELVTMSDFIRNWEGI